MLVRATDAGRRVQADIAARRRRFLDASLGALDASERAALADLLERLVQGVDDFAGITTGGRSAAG